MSVLLGKYLKLVPSGAPFDDIEDDVDLIVIFLRGHVVSGVGGRYIITKENPTYTSCLTRMRRRFRYFDSGIQWRV